MVSRFDQLTSLGLDRMRQNAGRTITYARGAGSVELTAVVGNSGHDQLDDTGMPVTAQSRDYIVKASDLMIGGTDVLPVAGDEITDGTATFVVRSIGSDAAWRYSDAARTTLRIHTVEVS